MLRTCAGLLLASLGALLIILFFIVLSAGQPDELTAYLIGGSLFLILPGLVLMVVGFIAARDR